MRFTVLGSGSRGNACLVRTDGPGLLIDAGLGPRTLDDRLRRIGLGWSAVGMVVLTHTHRDHVDDGTLEHLARLRIRVFCHEAHRAGLLERGGGRALESRGLLKVYDERPWLAGFGFRVEPVEAHHDDAATFGFRVEGRAGRGRSVAVGYLADTGMWTARQADALADADLLALEFNHDVGLQKSSGRPPVLIRRVLGHRGHLSNDQGAELLRAVLARSRPGRVRVVVLLHLSEECNRPELAVLAAKAAMSSSRARAAVHVARAHEPSPDVCLVRPVLARRRLGNRPAQARRGWDCPTWF